MKSLLTLATLLISSTAFSTEFKWISHNEILSDRLKALAVDAQSLQATSKIAQKLETQAVRTSNQGSQLEEKMIRQLLHTHQSCNGETEVSAEKSNDQTFKNVSTGFVGDVKESKAYLAKVEVFKSLLKATSGLVIYDISYSGGGNCEFGIDGFLILDPSTNEIVMIFKKWEA